MLAGVALLAAGLVLAIGPGPHVGQPAVAGVVLTAGGWGKAIEVPGLGALNKSRIGFTGAMSTSVSCGGPGNCSAGGSFIDGSGKTRAFVASQADGHWGDAIAIPPPSNGGEAGFFQINSISCASVSHCSAGGIYSDQARHAEAFVISQVSGHWGKAIEVPGIAGLNVGNNAEVTQISCASAGNCTAAGTYFDSRHSGTTQVFVVSEVRGTWGQAIELPGLASPDRSDPVADALSCSTPGNCAAGGTYRDSSESDQGFVADQTDGQWHAAIEVPGLAALNQQGAAWVGAISCPAPGSCGAGGGYADADQATQAYVVSEVHGHWGTALEVPGTARLNTAGSADISAISCPSPGNCGAGGAYDNGEQSGDFTNGEAFTVSESGGSWHPAAELPGIGSLNKGDDASILSISCPSPGNCGAGGRYSTQTREGRPTSDEAFAASETRGNWSTAIELPGFASLNKHKEGATVAISCITAGHCAASGFYTDGKFRFQAFVSNQR